MQRLYTVINITEIGENTVTDDATGNIICLPLEANETLVDERSKRTLLKPALLVEVYASVSCHIQYKALGTQTQRTKSKLHQELCIPAS